MSTVRVEGLKISRHPRYSTGATLVESKVAHEHARTTLKVSIFERSTRLPSNSQIATFQTWWRPEDLVS